MTKEERFAADYKKKLQRIAKAEIKTPQANPSYIPLHPDLFTLDEVCKLPPLPPPSPPSSLSLLPLTSLPLPPLPHLSPSPLLIYLLQRFFDADFMEAIRSGDEERLKGVLEEVTPRVFIFKMFNSEFCR